MDSFSILFVDDQPDILSTYKKLSAKDNSSRTYHYAVDGGEAMGVLENNTIDVLITDYNMPILDGLKLTEYVEKNFPQTVRVIVSGCMEHEFFVESMKHAHRFISKPTSLQSVLNVLESITIIHDFLHNSSINRELFNLTSIPTLPDVYTRVCVAMEKEEDFSLREIGDIIMTDVAMSTNILKFINSSFFHIDHTVTRIDQAVTLLGGDILKMLILRETIKRFVSGDENNIVERIFKHSSIVANIIKAILIYEKQNQDICDLGYTVGFLHDVGRLIMNHSFAKKYGLVAQRSAAGDIEIEDLEEEVIGITHSTLAAYVFTLWGMSPAIVQPVLCHHKGSESYNENKLILAALNFANAYEYIYVGSDVLYFSKHLESHCISVLGYEKKLETWKRIADEVVSALTV